ncbi:hypothetical protein MKZ38_005702 [Zalerion maritima]|uniref:Uncharacterized protein n=1 Tax=Zalerion maritima TaxID=339359 RepID=A0AAD5RKT8_9PEZI|nr:hypothetical protein MKZ38_005702 [Zalerion maritima]
MKSLVLVFILLGPCLAQDLHIPRTEAPETTSTSPPSTITNPAYIGSYYDFGLRGFSSYECTNNSTWRSIGTIGDCCAIDGGDCVMGTACTNGSVVLATGRPYTCEGSGRATVCVTGVVFENPQATNSVLNFRCWPDWNEDTWMATRTILEPVQTIASAADDILSYGAVAGVTIAAIAVIVIAIAVVFFCCGCMSCNKKRWRELRGSQEVQAVPTQPSIRPGEPPLIPVMEERRSPNPAMDGAALRSSLSGQGNGYGMAGPQYPPAAYRPAHMVRELSAQIQAREPYAQHAAAGVNGGGLYGVNAYSPEQYQNPHQYPMAGAGAAGVDAAAQNQNGHSYRQNSVNTQGSTAHIYANFGSHNSGASGVQARPRAEQATIGDQELAANTPTPEEEEAELRTLRPRSTGTAGEFDSGSGGGDGDGARVGRKPTSNGMPSTGLSPSCRRESQSMGGSSDGTGSAVNPGAIAGRGAENWDPLTTFS